MNTTNCPRCCTSMGVSDRFCCRCGYAVSPESPAAYSAHPAPAPTNGCATAAAILITVPFLCGLFALQTENSPAFRGIVAPFVLIAGLICVLCWYSALRRRT